MTVGVAPEGVVPLLESAGWALAETPDVVLQPLPGGANNRVFRVEVGGRAALLKAYFHHTADPRDRLGAEWAFLRFAWSRGIRSVPEPLACNPRARRGLYEFVVGRAMRSIDVDGAAIAAAADLVEALNNDRDDPEARSLPMASEACFSISDHVACVERRITALAALRPGGEGSDAAGLEFVHGSLLPTWRLIRKEVRQGARELGLPLGGQLPAGGRCVSPSDFGFHNALLTPEGAIRFVDFEYAGWDDPAKLVCDFFSQVAVPISFEHWDTFLDRVLTTLGGGDAEHARARLLLPAYRVKWCCILLNDFLPAGRQRRQFALGDDEWEVRKAEQLRKARESLGAITVASMPGERERA